MMRPLFGPKILPPVGINENELEATSFKVYPNPATDLVKIISEEVVDVSYSVIGMDGKLILSGVSSEINTQNLSNGIYLLVLSSQGKVQYRQKLIIQH
jgi:hypothetical protein